MTPKEKAFELITKFQHPISEKSDTECLHIEVAKEFALIAVDEMLNWFKAHSYSDKNYDAFVFYQEVKQEIDKL